MSLPLILVSNDDGIHSPGIERLARLASEFGRVVVCAPSQEQSGSSHAITLRHPLRAEELRSPKGPETEGWYHVDGTPVDCVYLGALHLCDHRPALVLSGINNGYNLGADVFYSGTVAAAREGYFRGSSGIAVSVAHDSDNTRADPILREIIPRVLKKVENGQRDLLNINIAPEGELGAYEFARLGQRRYRDQVEPRADLQGRPYYWIGGPPEPLEDNEGEDVRLITQGVSTVTPLTVDVTCGQIEDWKSD